ncbi:MAG: efflux RND transporter permease subunit [Saprospiraceae bacterium]|nr:efflux RND transporter permease subunit [Saprospiraceae bacterium]
MHKKTSGAERPPQCAASAPPSTVNITALSIRRPSLIIVVFAVLTFMGVASYFSLPIEMVPKFSPPVVTVITIYPGASPSEVENAVSKPIEDAVSSLEGIEQIQVSSQENSSFVTLELAQTVDVDKAVQEIQRKINQIQSSFPKEVRNPFVNKFAIDELPVLRLAVAGNLSGTAFYDLVKNRVVSEIAQIRGVAQVSILGGEEREIKINISSQRLEQYGLSLLQVAQAVQAANLDFPTGKVTGSDSQLRIRLAGKFLTLDDIRNLVVGRSRFGASIFLKDIAEIQDGARDPDVICRTDGQPAVGLVIRKQGDANAVEMSNLVLAKLKTLEQIYASQGLRFQVVANTSTFTKAATDAVIHDLFIAVLLVALVMLLFLHSLRNALIVLVSIPTSIVSTFVMMKLFGYSLNLLSLLGLSLAIGILVDDAIVVIENIYRHLEMGKNRVQASYDGRMEIGFTAISITLVDVVIFLPIIFQVGLVPNLLRQFCMTVLTSTLMSLFVSFTLVPWLTSRFAKVHRFKGKNLAGQAVLRFEKFIEWLTALFVGALGWALRSWKTKTLTLLTATSLFFGSFLLLTEGFIGNAFFDTGERGEFLLDIELPKDASLAQTNVVVKKVEEWLRQQPDVVRTFATVGANNKSFGVSAPYLAEIQVYLTPYGKQRDVSTLVYARKTKIKLEEIIVGATIRASPVDILGLSFSPIEVKLNGPDLDSLLVLSERVEREMALVPGCVEITPTVEGGNPEVSVEVNRQRMADYGLAMAQVGLTLQTAFSGNTDAKFRDGDYEYPIRVALDAFDRRSADDIRNLSFVNPLGTTVYLKQFADVRQSTAPTRLERRDRTASVMLTAQVIGRPNGSVGRDIKARLDTMPLPPSTQIKYGGDLKRQEQGVGTLGFALWTSLVLVYLIMVALYDNWVYPLVVLVSIPLSVIGAFLALALARENLTVFTGLGLLMLVGLVGKNAILVVDFANQLRERGTPLREALLQATKLRFRPVLMTNIAMVIGLLPIALAQGAGADWKNGLAWAIIGGLNSSMFLSLIVVPVVYWLFDRGLEKLGLDKKEKVELEE